MTYTIGFVKRDNLAVLAAKVPTANHALAVIATLEQSVGKLECIRSPQEGEIGIEMLRVRAKEETEEMPQTTC